MYSTYCTWGKSIRRNGRTFRAGVFKLRSFNLSMGLGCPRSLQSPMYSIYTSTQTTDCYLSEKRPLSPLALSQVIETEGGAQVRVTCPVFF
jgi:hypothetical protein